MNAARLKREHLAAQGAAAVEVEQPAPLAVVEQAAPTVAAAPVVVEQPAPLDAVAITSELDPLTVAVLDEIPDRRAAPITAAKRAQLAQGDELPDELPADLADELPDELAPLAAPPKRPRLAVLLGGGGLVAALVLAVSLGNRRPAVQAAPSVGQPAPVPAPPVVAVAADPLARPGRVATIGGRHVN